jgi:glycerol-3-phosphate dehydrogenase
VNTISIIGAGGWGTALATLIARNGHSVRLWARRAELADNLDRDRINPLYLPGIKIPRSIVVTSMLPEVATGDVLLFVTPSVSLRRVASELWATSLVRSSTIIAEMSRLGTALGGRRATFQGLSWAGDLIVTCFSRHSRNRRVGERIGQGERLDAIQHAMQMVAEGVPTARSARDCAKRQSVSTPIIDEVYSILYEDAAPAAAMARLISRSLRPEEG